MTKGQNVATPQSPLTLGDWSDIIIAVIVSISVYMSLLWFARRYEDGAYTALLVLAGLGGGTSGWVAGILISPYSQSERSTFAEWSKLIYGFITGYAISKLDPLVAEALRITPGSPPRLSLILFAYAIISFLVAVALTYVTRSYWIASGVTPASGTATTVPDA